MTPPPAPAPKCASNICSLVWTTTAGPDDPPSSCMKCAVVGGVKKQVSCGSIYSCGWKDPYVPTPPAPPTVFVAPPSTTTTPTTTSGGRGGSDCCSMINCSCNWVTYRSVIIDECDKYPPKKRRQNWQKPVDGHCTASWSSAGGICPNPSSYITQLGSVPDSSPCCDTLNYSYDTLSCP